jgi:hypothetical protein
MSKPLKPPVIAAIIAVAFLVLGMIGYKTMGPHASPERTDTAHVKVVEAMAAARAAKGKAGMHPGQ